MESNHNRQHYARQNNTRHELAELQEALHILPDTPPYWYGNETGGLEGLLATNIDEEKRGQNVGNNLQIGDVVWMLTPPPKGHPMGIIVDFGKKGFVRLRNGSSAKEFDLERKPEHLLYNDRFQTGIDERGFTYRFDPRHYMHTITLDHVARQEERIEELEQKCERWKKAYEAKEFGCRILTARLNVAASQADNIKKQRDNATKTLRLLRQKIHTHNVAIRHHRQNRAQPIIQQQDVADGFRNMPYPSTVTIEHAPGEQTDKTDDLSRDQHSQQPTDSK